MNYLEKNKNNFIKDLKGLIKIKSYLEDVNNYPTKELFNAVDYMISLGKEEGFRTYIEPKGYYGYIEMGQGTEMIGILGHLDVVPPGEDISKWQTPPFELNFEDGLLKGRGTQDDKGPVMLVFYLMKELKESSVKLKKRIRLIFPTDEESFWRGVEKYKSDKQEIPTFGFTPDALFPVTYSERELWEFKIIGKPSNEFTINAGAALNVVPDSAKYTNIDGTILSSEGKAAHAMEPHKGENAIIKLINRFESNNQLIKFIKKEINNETNGISLFNKLFKDDDSELTVNLATINIDDKKSEIALDLRVPNTTNSKELKKIILEKLKMYPNLTFEHYDFLQRVYISKESNLIKNLMESYEEVTGSKEKPLSSGGATYARAMKNIVAYGPYFKDTPMTEHQYNENAKWEDFIKAYDIYQNFIKKVI
ncbi:MAG: Sapep family Mn(2+)-dependent dipeptidase [Mycoplasmataceae bacterium]|nr:Sapep family Mn(2+)-dependent dipeptidase [Mycoplasmataceae bacterium]